MFILESLLYITIALLIIAICLLLVLLLTKRNGQATLEQQKLLTSELDKLKKQLQEEQLRFRQELLDQQQRMHSSNGEAAERLGKSNQELLQTMGTQLHQNLGDGLGAMRSAVDDKLQSMDGNLKESIYSLQETQAKQMTSFNEAVKEKMQDMTGKMEKLQQANEAKLGEMRTVLEQGMSKMQAENDRKLEDIRITVGEKLQNTLEERLTLSFKSINDNLKHVFESVGQMQELANEVGSLKTVLGNVKLRGNLGETQLEAILQEILTPDQYDTNVATIPGSRDRVEFAIKMPGSESGFVYLPIDAKFPADLYNHLQEAKETGDKEAVAAAYKALRTKVLADAKDIQTKYIKAPHTTDFGIMFLPFEGLYSEVLSLPGIMEELQKKHHIVPAGPSNMVAMLSSLRMGFKTLALQKRTSEIGTILQAVKSEFGKFGKCMESMKNHLDKTSQELDAMMNTRTRAITRSLSDVESMDLDKAEQLLAISGKEMENTDDELQK